MPRMTLRTSERVLPFPYAGLRGLGLPPLSGAHGQSMIAPGTSTPARRMSEKTNVEGLLADITASYPVEEYAERVRGLVTEARFGHIVRVTTLALKFASANGFSAAQRTQVATAAILHDAARDMTGEQLMELAPPELELERRHPLALHGRAARKLAADWGVSDEEVLAAIEGHVFGVPREHQVGMAVYVADVSEEGRGVNEQIRELAMEDLEAAYQLAVRAKVDYLTRTGKEIHPATLAAYRAIVGAPAGGHGGGNGGDATKKVEGAA